MRQCHFRPILQARPWLLIFWNIACSILAVCQAHSWVGRRGGEEGKSISCRSAGKENEPRPSARPARHRGGGFALFGCWVWVLVQRVRRAMRCIPETGKACALLRVLPVPPSSHNPGWDGGSQSVACPRSDMVQAKLPVERVQLWS